MKFKGLPYYWGAIAATKYIKAIVFVFLPGKAVDKVKLDACTGWVRHMGRFYENRIYAFALDARLTKGEAEVLLLDANCTGENNSLRRHAPLYPILFD